MRVPAFLLFVSLVAVPANAVPASARISNPLPAVAIYATAEQMFVPDRIVLHRNRRQTLRFTSRSGVHGVVSPELGIPMTTIEPDKFVSVSVMPKKTGTFVVPCSIVCGPGHANMLLTVVVKP